MTDENAPSVAETTDDTAIAATESAEQVENNDAAADDTTPEKQEDPVERIKRKSQERIDKMTAKHRELERQFEELRAQIGQSKEPAAKEREPQLEDFNTFDEYEKARADFLIEQGKKQALAELEGKQKAAKEAELAQAEAKRMESVRVDFEAAEKELKAEKADYSEKIEDFNDRLDNVPKGSLAAQVLREALFMSPKEAPSVIYALASEDGLLDKMEKMTPLQIAETIFETRFKLRNAPKEDAKPKPAPIKPVGGGAKTSTELSDKDSMDEWLKKRNAQLKGK